MDATGWMFLSGSAVTAIVIPQQVSSGNALVAGSLWLCDRRSHEMDCPKFGKGWNGGGIIQPFIASPTS